MDHSAAATLDGITVYPVKALDGVGVDDARIGDAGGLVRDREFAVVDADGDYVNGKNERRIHRVSADFDLGRRTVRLAAPRDDDAPAAAEFGLDDDRGGVESWLADFLGYDVSVVGEDPAGYPDDEAADGPTVVSTGTLAEVASWFDGVDAAEMKRRLRPNLVVDAAEAFWEDRLFGSRGDRVRFRVGDVALDGVNPCQRCVVPTRDPDTGEATPGFRERFVERRRETMPPWSGGDWFDHDYRLMVNTEVPASSRGDRFRVGDDVVIADE
ncbi:MOSC domain-containing protein [Halobaculum sp. D14]|uniref:MOSC domain-containing protein n=1 Tax=Halobaculum sp. D14 TaxID=3421642 RepID=UPI003EB9B3C1